MGDLSWAMSSNQSYTEASHWPRGQHSGYPYGHVQTENSTRSPDAGWPSSLHDCSMDTMNTQGAQRSCIKVLNVLADTLHTRVSILPLSLNMHMYLTCTWMPTSHVWIVWIFTCMKSQLNTNTSRSAFGMSHHWTMYLKEHLKKIKNK